MEIITLAFLVVLPAAFLIWTLKFKGLLSLTAIAPLMMLLIIVMSINAEATEQNPPRLTHTYTMPLGCVALVHNATVTEGGNFTAYSTEPVCQSETVTDTYEIGFRNMNIINFSMSIFVISVSVVVFRRVTRKRNVQES